MNRTSRRERSSSNATFFHVAVQFDDWPYRVSDVRLTHGGAPRGLPAHTVTLGDEERWGPLRRSVGTLATWSDTTRKPSAWTSVRRLSAKSRDRKRTLKTPARLKKKPVSRTRLHFDHESEEASCTRRFA